MSREKLIIALIDQIRENQVLTDVLDEAAAAYLGINRTDANALDVIDRHGRITAGDLSAELRISTGAVTAVVDRLVHARFARRVADPHDRRRVLIEVTAEVKENAERIYGRPGVGATPFKEFTDAEMDVVRRFLQLRQAWIEERIEKLSGLSNREPSPSSSRKPRKKPSRDRGWS